MKAFSFTKKKEDHDKPAAQPSVKNTTDDATPAYDLNGGVKMMLGMIPAPIRRKFHAAMIDEKIRLVIYAADSGKFGLSFQKADDAGEFKEVMKTEF